MTEGQCRRCGSGGYGCYECTPITYTQADLDAAVNEALERAAAKMDAEWSYRAGDAIRAMKKETGK